MVQERNNREQTVLITRFSAVGDIAMTIPLLYPLAEAYPQYRFVFMSRKRFGDFLINKPGNLEFKGIDPNAYKGIFGLYKLYKEIKSEYNPDIVADLHDVLRTKVLRILFSWSNAKTAHIVKGRAEKQKLIRGGSKNHKRLRSTFERYRDVFATLGLPFESNFVSLFGNSKGDIGDFADILPIKGSDRWIGIAPFARHRGKIYPLELMRKVVMEISQEKGVKVICFGNGPQEEEVVNSWCRDFENVYSFVGKSNFNGELRLISNLDLMVSMDSANMHLASLVNTPVVSIWGATSPIAGFLGWRQKEEDCIQLSLECRPCSIFGNKPCRMGDYRCFDIAPKEVAKRIINRLNR